MDARRTRTGLFLAMLLATGLGGPPAMSDDLPATTEPPILFSRDVQPILAQNCLLCHGPDDAQGGLRLDSAERARAILDSGQFAIVSHEPERSELFRRVTADDEFERMPPEGDPLSAEQIAVLRQWIEQGAIWEEHWAFRPVENPPLPEVRDSDWIRNSIDQFVLARLEAVNLSPSPPADRAVLVKRLYYDLIGLPPAPGEVEGFVHDTSDNAVEQLVDRLLSSPRFGERWGRDWLDKARYADSDGYEKDNPRPQAWRYRDWVIAAVNQDLPFDRFSIEQLAGDLLPEATPGQRLATAFHRQTLTNTEGGTDQEEFRVEATFDRTETTAAVWMGLTMTCARCHSHKYDQITQHEYYQLFSFFNAANEANLSVPESEQAMDRYRRELAEYERKVAELERQQAEAAEASESEAAQALAELQQNPPQPPLVNAAVMAQGDRTTRLLYRGDFLQPSDEVSSGGLAVVENLHPLTPGRPDQPADRLDLARWLVDPQHPLTSRVTVNQVWSRLFGRGIVPTVDDFGVRGEPPTHPELLDWLAYQFPRGMNFSRKSLIRMIVTSATYQQSSWHRPELDAIDPTNHLLARQNRLRVEAEIVRDLHLSVAGLMSSKIGGPSVFPQLPPGVAELSYANNFKWTTSPGEDRYRRGMYTFFKRTAPHPTLISFDCPDANTTRLQRGISNTPLQALVTLNNDVFIEAAQAAARRVLGESFATDFDRLNQVVRWCIARAPDREEVLPFLELLDEARSYYAEHPDEAARLTARHAAPHVPAIENAAWVAAVRMVLNLDEFIVRD